MDYAKSGVRLVRVPREGGGYVIDVERPSVEVRAAMCSLIVRIGTDAASQLLQQIMERAERMPLSAAGEPTRQTLQGESQNPDRCE